MRRVGWTVAVVCLVLGGFLAYRACGGRSETTTAQPAPHPDLQYQPSSAERVARQTNLRYLQCKPRHWRYCVIPR